MSSYADIRDDLKTGDLVFFEGAGPWATLIKRFCGGPFCHVAMIVEDMTGGLGIWESTGGKKKDGGVWGVQETSLSARLKKEEAPVWVRQFEDLLTPEELKIIGEVRREFEGRHYDADLMAMLIAIQPGTGMAFKAEDTLFCSELIGAALGRLGYVDGVSSQWTPPDFSTHARPPLVLLKNRLGPEVKIA